MSENSCPHCDAPIFSADAKLCWRCGRSLDPNQPDAAQPLEGDDAGNWLNHLRDETEEDSAWLSPDEENAEVEPVGEDDIPEWLARVRQRTQLERDQDDDNVTPEWLLNLQREGRVEDFPAPADASLEHPAESVNGMDVPDNAQPEQSGAENAEDEPKPEAGNRTEDSWLVGFDEWEKGSPVDRGGGTLDFSGDEPDDEDQALNEWLSRMNDSEKPPPVETPIENPAVGLGWVPEQVNETSNQPDDWEGLTAGEESPADVNWFSDLVGPAGDETAALDGEGQQNAAQDDGGLDWLTQAAETPAGARPESEPAAEEELAPAELPNWLESMRPVESIAPPTGSKPDRSVVEQSGPLAGLPGVIPPDHAPIQYSRPSMNSGELNVTDKQRTHAALLEEMLAEEGQPKQSQHARNKNSGAGLRLFISLLVLGTLVVGVALPGSASTADFASGAVHTSSYFQNLLAGAVVIAASL